MTSPFKIALFAACIAAGAGVASTSRIASTPDPVMPTAAATMPWDLHRAGPLLAARVAQEPVGERPLGSAAPAVLRFAAR